MTGRLTHFWTSRPSSPARDSQRSRCPGVDTQRTLLSVRTLSMLIWVTAITVWSAFPANHAEAGNGDLSPSILVGKRNVPTSLMITIDSRWVAGDGYRPLRLQARTVGNAPLPRDRQLTIELRPRGRYGRLKRTIRETIELPAGTANWSKTIYLPENPDCQSCQVKLWVGEFDPRRSGNTSIGFSNGNQLADTTPRVLFLDSNAPSFEALGSRTPSAYRPKENEDLDKIVVPNGFIRSIPQMSQNRNNNNGQRWQNDSDWYEVNTQLATGHILNPVDIPSEWLGLTNLDIITISFADLKQLRETKPQWDSLTRWMRCGGNLWVTGCGDKYSKHAEVATLLELPGSDLKLWKAADTRRYGKVIEALEVDQYGNNIAPNPSSSNKKAKRKAAVKLKDPVRFRDVQLGTVALFADEDALRNGDRLYWHWVLKSLGTERWMWIERNGVSGVRENRGFWKFMVPGVGLAPVKTFVVLLTLFVLGIGPVSFVVLRRWNRPNWLMFTVPIAAAIVTLGLISYALLTDGLSVRGRSRTITHLDQRAGIEATWSRQAYYAGLPPSGGLRYSDECAVYPIDFAPQADYIRQRRMDWTGTEQHLQKGFLGSRETSQFLVQRCRPSSAGLDIERVGER